VPESQWPERVKKTGRGMILAGVAVVVPGVLVDNISLPVTIAMQVCYASLIGLGVLLAFDEKKPEAGMNMNINLKETVCSLKN
jgi:hydrogenase/urease accessory protein HupE